MSKRQFFMKLIVGVFAFIALDRGIGGLLEHFYFTIKHGEQRRTTFAADSCVAQTIILGSSRAAHHYVTPVIADALGTSCYNAGKDKQGLRYCLAMLTMMYRRYSPKQIILDLNPTALETSENDFDVLSVLLPYYHAHPEIRPILNERSRFEWIKTQSDLYRYNSLPLKIFFNNLSSERDANETSGYVPLIIQKERVPAMPQPPPSPMPADPDLVNCLKAIIKLAKDNGSELYVVISPIYYRLPENVPTLQLTKSICDDYKISLLDYSQDPLFLDHGPAAFSDLQHLNDSAAKQFSRLLANDLKKIQAAREH